MNLDPVTSRWTQALFQLAQRQGALEEVAKDVDQIAAEFSSEKVGPWLASQDVPAVERRAKLEPVLASFHEITRNFVGLAFDRRREEVLVGLAAAFRRLRLEDARAIEGTVESARAMDATQLESLATSLGARLGKTVHLENRVDPDLIGGFRVFIGSSLLDCSVAGRLDGLRATMMNAPLPVTSAS